MSNFDDQMEWLQRHAQSGPSCAVCHWAWHEIKRLVKERDALAAELATLRRRWNHVAGLAQTMGVKMDGQNSWRFEPLRYGRGPTIEAAVDDEIERIEKARDA